MDTPTTTLFLDWKQLDPEARWGFRAKKFTAVNQLVALGWGVIFTLVFYGILYPFHLTNKWLAIEMFFHGGAANRSVIPYIIVLLSCWCLAFLMQKSRKLRIQRKALAVIPFQDDKNFTVSPMNAQEIISTINLQANRAQDFLVLARMERTLTSLRNIGHISDVSALLSDMAEADTIFMETTYTLCKGLIWAIPILGFIGTVPRIITKRVSS